MSKVTLEDVRKAREVVKDVIEKTPMLRGIAISKKTGANIYYKCECFQKTGAFKIRGAYNKISSLSEEEKAKGVIAASSGNHAQGVALSAKMLGLDATVVMPTCAPEAKVASTRENGANVVLTGNVFDEAFAEAKRMEKETGKTFLHPFDDPYVIAGQGTITLEMYEALDGKIDTILCPIGGGGVLAGTLVTAKALNPNIKVIGIQTDNMPSMKASLDNGEVSSAHNGPTFADGIAVMRPGELTFSIVKELVDDIITVSEKEMADAVLYLLKNQKIVAEGAAATSTAVLLSGKYVPKKDENVACIITGGNIDPAMLVKIINGEVK